MQLWIKFVLFYNSPRSRYWSLGVEKNICLLLCNNCFRHGRYATVVEEVPTLIAVGVCLIMASRVTTTCVHYQCAQVVDAMLRRPFLRERLTEMRPHVERVHWVADEAREFVAVTIVTLEMEY